MTKRYPCLLALSAVLLTGAARAEPIATSPRAEPALAATFEVLSPLGGAGCFYRHRYLLGALVTVSSLISGGLMLHGVTHGNGDEISLNAVAYGVSRLIGVVAAARPDPPPASAPPPPAPRTAALPAFAGPTIGLSYGLSF